MLRSSALQKICTRPPQHNKHAWQTSCLYHSSRNARGPSRQHLHAADSNRTYSICRATDPATSTFSGQESNSSQQQQTVSGGSSSSSSSMGATNPLLAPADVTQYNESRSSRGRSSSGRGRGRGGSSSSRKSRGAYRSSTSSSSSSSHGRTDKHDQQQQQQQQQRAMRQQQPHQQSYPQQQKPQQQGRQQGVQPYQHQQQQQQQQQQRQQPVLLFQGTSVSQKKDEAAALASLLTAKISNCKDLQQLSEVLAMHEGVLNPVHLSAAISRAAKLHPGQLAQQQQQQQQHLHQLVSQTLQQFINQLPAASPLEVSCVIGGLARLSYNTPRDVIDACLDATRDVMTSNSVSNKELLQLAWGLARLGQKPDDAWLSAFERATYNRMPSFNNIETANVLWVFAKWGSTPPEPWLAAWLSQLPSQLLLLQPPELCSILWSAAMLQLQLPGTILDGLLLEAQVKFSSFRAQGFGTLAWALARMDIKPKRLWLQDFVRQSGTMLASCATAARDQPLTNIIWALGCWEHTPPTPWLQEYCRCVVPQLGNMLPQGLAIVAVGLAELNHKPPQPFTSYLLELFHKQLTAATAAQAAAFIWALPRLLLPQMHSAAAAQQQQVRFAPSGWIRQYCWLLQDIADQILPGLDKLSATELVDVISGFADIGFFPGVPWMDAHEVNLNRRLDQVTAAQVNLVKQAYLALEQQQAVQQQLLHPEQLKLLQQQQAAAAAAAPGVTGVRPGPGSVWRSSNSSSSSSSSLEQSAAAAAAATAADKLGVDAALLGNSMPAAAEDQHEQGSSSSNSSSSSGGSLRNRRLEPPGWASSSSSARQQQQQQRGRGRGRRGRGRGRGSSNPLVNGSWDDDFSDDYQETLDGLGISNQPPGLLPQMPNKPRAARIRLQKIREAERQEREQEKAEWRQRWQQQQQQQRGARGQQREKWRVAQPGEFADQEEA